MKLIFYPQLLFLAPCFFVTEQDNQMYVDKTAKMSETISEISKI